MAWFSFGNRRQTGDSGGVSREQHWAKVQGYSRLNTELNMNSANAAAAQDRVWNSARAGESFAATRSRGNKIQSYYDQTTRDIHSAHKQGVYDWYQGKTPPGPPAPPTASPSAFTRPPRPSAPSSGMARPARPV